MSHSHIRLPRLPALCAALGLLASAGCNVVPPPQADSTRFFVLSGAELSAPGAVQAPAGTLRIGIRNVRLESYLNRKEMVVRMGANEIRFEDYRRWADPLDSALTRIVRSKLLAAPAVAQVYAEPFPFDQARDFDVSIDVVRFEGAVGADGKYSAGMAAVVEISTTGAGSRIVSRKLFEAPAQAWDGADFDRLAALLRADVDLLAQEVASELPAKP
jgi:uncharacterized lipoprotein YmbA